MGSYNAQNMRRVEDIYYVQSGKLQPAVNVYYEKLIGPPALPVNIPNDPWHQTTVKSDI